MRDMLDVYELISSIVIALDTSYDLSPSFFFICFEQTCLWCGTNQFRREWANPFKGAKGRLAAIKYEQAKLQRDKKRQIDQIVASMYGRYGVEL